MSNPAFIIRLTAVCIAFCLGQIDALAEGSGEVNLFKPIPELALKNGRIYKNVQIVSYATHSVTAKWDGGAGTIDYKLLPEEIRVAAEANRPGKAQESRSQRMSYKDYLKKHPAPAKPAPRSEVPGMTQPVTGASEKPQSKEARRTALAKEIARQQLIMDAYEKQNAAAKKSLGITEDQYAAAKSARDKAQAERDELAR